MNSAFWQGFREGYRKSVLIGVPIIFALLAGWSFGMYFHPFEKCERMYTINEDIIECVWLLRNN